MEKNCTLVKSLKTVKGKDGAERSFVNYFLDFGNGIVLPIQLREYSVGKDAKKEDVERVNRYNHDNYIRISTLAFDATK